MAGASYFEKYLFSGLAYRTPQYMVSDIFWVQEFIFDADLMIGPVFDLKIQNGCRKIQNGRHKLFVGFHAKTGNWRGFANIELLVFLKKARPEVYIQWRTKV